MSVGRTDGRRNGECENGRGGKKKKKLANEDEWSEGGKIGKPDRKNSEEGEGVGERC